jgi:hypothetical protein
MSGIRWRPAPRTRKLLLLTHIASAGAWLGIDLVLGIMVFTALLSGDGLDGATAIASLGYFATWPLAILGLLCLATGVLLGLGSKYGLLRYWWVAVKLVLNVVLVTLVLVALSPEVGPLSESARQSLPDGGVLPEMSDMVYPPVVSTTAVLFAMTLSVFKPWGAIRRLRADPTGGVGFGAFAPDPTGGVGGRQVEPGGRQVEPGARRAEPEGRRHGGALARR